MVRTNQGGSILSFAILGVVMALLLVGGVYVVRHNLAPQGGEPEVAVSGDEKDSSKEASSGDKTPAPSKSDQAGESGTTGSAAPNDTKNSGDKSVQRVPAPAAAPVSPNQTSNGLPTTGPSDVAFDGIILSGLIALLVAYMQSRGRRVSL